VSAHVVRAVDVDGPDLGAAAGAVCTRLTRRTVETGEPLLLAGEAVESIVWALDRDLAAARLPGDAERSLRADRHVDLLVFEGGGPTLTPQPPGRVVQPSQVRARRTDEAMTAVARRDIGRAAGSVTVGLKVVEVDRGRRSHPFHCHAAEEELFYVLAGDGALRLGRDEHAIGPGHVIARPAGTGVAHEFLAGPRGLTYLAFGQRVPGDACFYPDSGKVSLPGLGVLFRPERTGYWA
jgi:uncharacterized cupin superfamily protein